MSTIGIILAAGEGKRMHSGIPKVLHKAGGLPLLGWVTRALENAGIADTVCVVGKGADKVMESFPELKFVTQKERRGTGHAVMQAQDFLRGKDGYTFIAAGDMPLLESETVRAMIQEANDQELDCVLLSAVLDDPTGYGRIIRADDGNVDLIVEHKDASEAQRSVKEINASCYCVRTEILVELLPTLETQNAQGEYYLTDIIEKINQNGGSSSTPGALGRMPGG